MQILDDTRLAGLHLYHRVTESLAQVNPGQNLMEPCLALPP